MSLVVERVGLLAIVQDLGRIGHGHHGVSRSGAADRGALIAANRLVGNPDGAAGLEVLNGGLRLRAVEDCVVAVTGASCVVEVDGREAAWGARVTVAAGAVLSVGRATQGLRAYVSVGGGIEVAPVLGSRSYDQLARLGPPPVKAGDVVEVGASSGEPQLIEVREVPEEIVLRVVAGPRVDWLVGDLTGQRWTVSVSSDRTGTRLQGVPVERRSGELASEGMLRGAIQLPPDGQPIILGPDAGVTGGYPVVAVVIDDDLDLTGQLRPGSGVRLTMA